MSIPFLTVQDRKWFQHLQLTARAAPFETDRICVSRYIHMLSSLLALSNTVTLLATIEQTLHHWMMQIA
jgi:hypothetical protein